MTFFLWNHHINLSNRKPKTSRKAVLQKSFCWLFRYFSFFPVFQSRVRWSLIKSHFFLIMLIIYFYDHQSVKYWGKQDRLQCFYRSTKHVPQTLPLLRTVSQWCNIIFEKALISSTCIFMKYLAFLKGQLISKANSKLFIWTEKTTKMFLYFCPSL